MFHLSVAAWDAILSAAAWKPVERTKALAPEVRHEVERVTAAHVGRAMISPAKALKRVAKLRGLAGKLALAIAETPTDDAIYADALIARRNH
jgi:hypothetical protein